ncbi:hypothetical protein V8F20_004415 [Naviculisporaceae sp. PSN 640]
MRSLLQSRVRELCILYVQVLTWSCHNSKRRHIKCDEGHPVCRLCTMAEREKFCSYGPLPSSAANAPSPAHGNTRANVPNLVTSSNETTPSSTSSDFNMGVLEPPRHNLPSIQQQPSPSPNQTPFSTPVPDPSLPGEALNMQHIELVVHMMRTKGMFNLGVNIGNYYKQMAIGFEYGLKDPYLTHQFLAYSARHLAHLHPDQYLYYTHQADTHQARAIQLFNLAISPSTSDPSSSSQGSHNPINQSNCVAVVLFSSVLGQTLIAETFDPKLHPTFIHPNGSLDEFLRSYTQCLNTFRGVYHIGASAWPLLLNTPLAGYLLYSRDFNNQVPTGHQCDLLVELLNLTHKLGKMSDIEHQVCLQMARYLQVGFDAILNTAESSDRFLNKSLNKYQMLSAFTMLCPAEFSALLEHKRPEALVILGYYALLLHYGRHMWQVGEAGRVILGMVDGYLGTLDQQWREWLRGPVKIVFGEGYEYRH